MAAVAKHLGLVVFGCLLTVAVLEVGLRVASVVVRTVGDRSRDAVGDLDRTILCVGDSHTYGAPLPRDESYPSQLSQYLASADPSRRWRVINRGVPGMNAAQVAAALEGWLRQDRADLVVVWVGANNLWNRDDPAGIREDRAAGTLAPFLAESRLYRLYLAFAAQSVLEDWDSFTKAVFETSKPWLGAAPMPPRERYLATVKDLSHVGETLARYRVPWLLVTYPLDYFSWHTDATEVIARKWHVGVVYTSEDLSRARRDHADALMGCPWPPPGDRECLFVNAMGPHPTKLLYRYIAESIGEKILKTLREQVGNLSGGR